MPVSFDKDLFVEIVEELQVSNWSVFAASRVDQRHAVFDYQPGLGEFRIQYELMSIAFQLDFGAGCQVQRVAEFFGDYDAAGFVDFHNGSHNGIQNTIFNGVSGDLRLQSKLLGVF